MSRIAAVILAAGSSSRLGEPKQLLDLGGQPVLAHTLAAVRRTSLTPRFIVLGHAADKIKQRIDLNGVETIFNPGFQSGQSSSVRVALDALPPDVDAAVFILGDQPLVEPAVIDRLARAYRAENAPIIQPNYREGRGNPVLIARALFSELAQVNGDTGARPLIQRHREAVFLVDATEFARPDDIDTREDYDRVQRAFSVKQRA
ncbi:MAG TPA: nucleotidyltransferase family protein [Nitrolancea sp.]